MLPDGRVLVIGGHGRNGVLDSTEIFDPVANSFSRGPSLNRARAGHTATVLDDGRILIVGGDGEGSTELFDPATKGFSLITAHLSAPRASHSTALLKNGKVLIAGGLGHDGNAVQTGEILDLETMQVSATDNSMHGARTRPTLNVLPDGKVQVIGGDDERTMEMFNPEGEHFTAYAHLTPESDSISGVLRAQTRAALIHELASGNFRLQAELSRAIDELLDRSEHSLVDVPESGIAIIAGGKSSQGKSLKSFVLLSSSGATVTTDKTDYAPGETVTVTGQGFGPDEDVKLTFHRDNGSDDTILWARTDDLGNFTNDEYVCQTTDADVSFILTAEGQSSHYTAQTTFTDAELVTAELTGSTNDVTVTQGSSAPFTISLTALGAMKCPSTPSNPAVVKVNTSYSISSLGTLSSSTLSGPFNFFAASPCTGVNGLVTWTGAPSAYTVGASVSAAATTPPGDYTITLSEAAGTVAITDATGSGANLDDATATLITVHVLAACTPPSISSSPSGATKCVGESVTFTVVASGTDLHYQWRKGGVPIGGAPDSASYTIVSVTTGDAGSYDVVVSGACSPSATSGAATLIVNTGPAVTTNPINQMLCAGATASFTAAASGSPTPTVQWQVSTGGPFTDIPGATSTTLSFTTAVGDNGKQYRAVFTNTCGSATTTAATLAVNTAPSVTTNPSNQAVCASYTATFNAAASGSPTPTVQWQVSTGGPFADIPGATSTTLSFATVAGDNGTQYRAVFTNTCGSATSAPATLTVNTAPLSVAVSGPSGPIAKGTLASLTVTFTGPVSLGHTVNISWDDTTSSSIPVAAGTFTTGAVNHLYASAGVYSVGVSVTNTCGSVSTTFQYIVIYDPGAGFVTGGGWIMSPAGAYAADTTLTGKANFGFVSKYQKGATVPVGETEFQFQCAGFNFHSSSYYWLVISGAKAQYKGTGTVNGVSGFEFLLTATDGQVNGGGGVDKFRIKIWNGDGIVYDNNPGGSDDIDTAYPQAIAGGSIVIHK